MGSSAIMSFYQYHGYSSGEQGLTRQGPGFPMAKPCLLGLFTCL